MNDSLEEYLKKIGYKRPKTDEDWLKDDPLAEYHVWWDDINDEDFERLEKCLNEAKNEHDMQKFLKEHPILLVQHLGCGNGRWVIPQKRLGSEYVTDFVIGERHSFGYDWYAVELESPKKKMFNKNGDLSACLNHAIKQITEWRGWIKRNNSYATNAKDKGGLGLTDIDFNVEGLILLGRRDDNNPSTHELRRSYVQQNNIKIRTYDFLLDKTMERVAAVKEMRRHR